MLPPLTLNPEVPSPLLLTPAWANMTRVMSGSPKKSGDAFMSFEFKVVVPAITDFN